ncbi:ABC transporter ATP-binding protein [Peribacillus alkalitolerans]|uniref:ABC transporter ATP-binding protein n=1 Tax=Peribacillus alkalitolerans TaxID=1550385 RepID=UPI0013D0252D|nr:ABC transporter ATP-binding protein [Peribacillus alkalitolerans]
MSFHLEMKNMTKKYGHFLANDNVSLSVKKGEVHAIVGENGAGKTTLMRMLYGMEKPTSGSILLNGKPVNFDGPNDAIKNGIGMVHQHFMLFSDFTAAENIVIGMEPNSFGFFQRNQSLERVKKLAETFQLQVRPNIKVTNTSIGEQQRIEILKVLYQGAEVIILDEPTAVLTPTEVKGLLKSIRHLADQGKSVILITHKLREVMEVADHITVLKSGKVTGSIRKEDTSIDELAQLMVGRELKALSERTKMELKPVLEVKNVHIQGKNDKPVLENVTFQVNRGEIVGIAGVSGNGQSELVQAITGLKKIHSGHIVIGGLDVTNKPVADGRTEGIAHIPEDRYLWGAARQATVEENAIMGFYKKSSFNRKTFILKKRFRKLLEEWITRFEIKTASIFEVSGNLSGGNLQKLIVAREFAQQTPVLIAVEPTRGVDIGAMEYIHEALIEKRNNGDSVLLVSSELTEILALSDRIIVIYEGKIAGEIKREKATEEQLSILMAGGKTDDHTFKSAAIV